MLSKALITAAVALCALVSNGNGSASAIDPSQRKLPEPRTITSLPDCEEPAGDTNQDQREEFHQTYPLSPTGRVSLENLNGGVQIRAWDRAEVQIDAVKRAYRRERLAEAKIEINASQDNIRIKTEYPDWNQSYYKDERRWDNPAIVDYTLTVPRKAILESIELVNGSVDIDSVEGSVKASSINGRLTARGLQGDTRLSTINGQLQATFTQLDESKPIFLQSVNGQVTLIIPSDSNASVRASTVHGSITNDFGMNVRHGEYVGHDLNGQIGNGGPRIKLSNVNGGIRVLHAQDGRPLSPATSEIATTGEVSDIDATVAEQVRQTTREANKIARDAAREAARRDVVLREAQREVARAQAEIQREAERQIREQVREQVRVETRTNINVGIGVGTGSGTGYGGRFMSQETKTFSVTGTPRVNIGTFDGSVVVHGWDKPEVMYTVTKRAEEDALLKQISVKAEQQGSSISIIANSEESAGTAHVEVHVPRLASVHVTSEDGSVQLDGVSGNLTLRTGDGSIQVNNAGGQLQANTGDGSIRVGNFDGQVDARTGDGSITLDGNFNAVTARTGDGSISLAVPPGSNFTVETNADDTVINEGLLLTEDVTPTQRVRRWRVGNGGKVFVLNTGDGRIVVRSR
ncbi:MAG TPA: DUF4097 family beta strand repeat-containing protein [Pyrinomonadaceae bacterium]|nr:DUF4097 family beta strand repeat-containing protein [Pyrinomonadaceae bacterium]